MAWKASSAAAWSGATRRHTPRTIDAAIKTFEAVAEKLHFEDWCERIDERAEAVEDTYEVIGEKLLEFKNFAAEAILEILIVLILLGELALTLWEMFGP